MNKQRDAFARHGDGDGDEQLADELWERFQFVFVVEPAEQGYRNRAERNDAEFNGAAIDAVNNQ